MYDVKNLIALVSFKDIGYLNIFIILSVHTSN